METTVLQMQSNVREKKMETKDTSLKGKGKHKIKWRNMKEQEGNVRFSYFFHYFLIISHLYFLNIFSH